MEPIVIVLSVVVVILIIIAIYYIFFVLPDKDGNGRLSKIEGFSDGIKVISPCTYPPIIVRHGKCRYPMVARKAHIDATVIIDIHLSESGHIIESQVPYVIGYELEEAAMEYIEKWSFRPAIHNGKSTDVWIRIPISFKLKYPKKTDNK